MTYLIRVFLLSLILVITGCTNKTPVTDSVTSDSVDDEHTELQPIEEFSLNPNLSEVDENDAIDSVVMGDVTSTDRPIPHEELRAIRDMSGTITSLEMLNSMENQTVWQVIEQNFELEHYDHELIDQYYNVLTKHRSSVERIELRAKYYMPSIAKMVIDAGLPGEIALIPIVESNLKPMARSKAGAGGMWQFMPATGATFGLKRNSWWDARFDIELSTASAIEYLSYLNERFNGNWLLALAAYNCGEACVERAVDNNRAAGKGTDLFDLDSLPRETRRYVPKLLAIKKLVENDFVKVTDPSDPHYIAFSPTYRNIYIDKPTELSVIANEASISLEDLEILNSGILKGVTPPGIAVNVHIPRHVDKDVDARIVALPQSERVDWQSYTVKKGDTIGKIAENYNLPTQTLRETNSLSGSLIRIGQQLIIPLPNSKSSSASHSIAEDVNAGKTASYKVRNGDTLSTIAHSHNISIGQLTKANKITSRDVLTPGQYLTIPK